MAPRRPERQTDTNRKSFYSGVIVGLYSAMMIGFAVYYIAGIYNGNP